MSPELVAEEELLRRWRNSRCADERRALQGQLLLPYLDRITRWALRITRDREEAQDVAQDALFAICSHMDRFRGESRFSTWVYTIVRNHAFKRAARGRETSADELPEQPAEGPGPAQSYERARQAEDIRSLIASELTPTEARVFLLHFGKDIPLAVLDRELDLTNRSGARAYLVSAKRKLRRKLERRTRQTEARLERHREMMRGRRELP